MKKQIDKAISRKDLVKELHKLGLAEVNERRIIDWQGKHLLPTFNEIGRGFGKGKGKAASKWKNGRRVIEQTVWVDRLLRIYRSSYDLYLPLWILGFEVPIELVRGALNEPLLTLIEDLKNDSLEEMQKTELVERMDGVIEDFIDDLASKLAVKDKFLELLGVPQEVIAAAGNLLLNASYRLDDDSPEEAIDALERWKKESNDIEKLLVQGLNVNSDDTSLTNKPSPIEVLFANASFVQQHLSLHKFHAALSAATVKDLEEVQVDMQILCEMAEGIGKTISIMLSDFPTNEKLFLDEALPALFAFAKLLILANLSLRRNGFSEVINMVRWNVLQTFKADLSKVNEKALAAEGLKFVTAIETGLKTIEKNLEKLIDLKMPKVLVPRITGV